MAKKQETKEPEAGTALMSYEDEMAAAATAIAKTERPSTGKISFKSGVMSYMDNAMPNNEMECIILAHAQENVYYTDKWKANEVKPPACFALALGGEQMVPHEDVPNPPGTVCATCEMFAWGSDPGGGKGKACKERRRLGLIPAPGKLEDLAESEMATASIPVTSVKNWANYVNKLSATMQRPPWGVITLIKLVPDARSQFKVLFQPVRPLENEEIGLIRSRIAVANNAILTPYEMNPEQEEEKEEGEKKY